MLVWELNVSILHHPCVTKKKNDDHNEVFISQNDVMIVVLVYLMTVSSTRVSRQKKRVLVKIVGGIGGG